MSFIACTLGPVVLASTAIVLEQNGDGCSRVESDHSLDVCPFVDETVLFNCQYDSTVPPTLQALAGTLTLLDNTNAVSGSQTVLFSSPSQNGQYSCQSANPVCSNDVARQNFNIAVLG